jgi:hypothetical protein
VIVRALRQRQTFLAGGIAAALLTAVISCRTQPFAGPAVVVAQQPAPQTPPVQLPNAPDGLKFAVLGDFGTGETPEYRTAREMNEVHGRFPFTFVILVGDNLYGSERPQDFRTKFEDPYRPLLDGGVKFYASLGNHDSREQRFYQPFNMDGQLHYTFSPKANVRFFALESSYMDPDQVKWVEQALSGSGSDWKIVYFHHPLYSSARRHGSDVDLRQVLEPLFIKYNVSVVFTGHDHVYERIKPQHGIVYFVTGSGGQLRSGDLQDGSPLTAAGFDTDRAFLVAEIDGDTLTFQAISRTGRVVDSGTIARRGSAGATQ